MKRVIGSMLICGLSVFLSMIGFLGIGPVEVDANGAPIKIILTYQPNLSNWGPTDASGVAEVVMKEGEVNLDVVGLPHLADKTYAAWLINTRNNESAVVGRFNTDDSNVGKLKVVLPSEIPDKGWNLFLVTVESGTGASASPGQERSIGGYFPDSSHAAQLPSQLPKTGGDVDPNVVHSNPQAVPLATPTPNTSSGGSFLTYGIVALAAVGLGVFARIRRNRKQPVAGGERVD